MTNFNFSKARNFPINRDGETIEVQANEGDLIGLQDDGSGNTEIVAADADSGTQQPAMGVCLEEVRDPTNVNVSGFETAYIEQNQLRRQMREETDYTFVGEEGTYVRYGVYLEDVDGDESFTPQEPVYLDTGGGVTQTKPSSPGDLVQRVGVAVDQTTYFLFVEDYHVVESADGEATFSGDGSQTQFDIAHGLNSTPAVYDVTPTTAAAAGDYYVNATATNLEVNYTSAPGSGTDNVVLNWSAQE